MYFTQQKQSGVALIVVMLIVAIITVLAVEMSGRLQLNIARTLNVKANNQAFWYALGAEQFAKNSLTTLQSATGGNINLSQPWAQDFEYPVLGGSIKAKLTDLQACFNLNAINSDHQPPNPSANPAPKPKNKSNISPSQSAFENLLQTYIEDTYVTDTIRDSLVDWIDEDDNPSAFGAEDADYESLPIPYLPANNLMTHASELRLINGIEEGVSASAIKAIVSAVCVLPEKNLKVNVNTISEDNAVVLAALLGDTLQTGQDIISSRPEQGFDDINDFLNLSEVKALNLSAQQTQWFDITTKYFRLDTTAKFQGSQFRMSTVFKLESNDVIIYSREFGGAF